MTQLLFSQWLRSFLLPPFCSYFAVFVVLSLALVETSLDLIAVFLNVCVIIKVSSQLIHKGQIRRVR